MIWLELQGKRHCLMLWKQIKQSQISGFKLWWSSKQVMVFWRGELLRELTVRLHWCSLRKSSRLNVYISFLEMLLKKRLLENVFAKVISQCVWKMIIVLFSLPLPWVCFEVWEKEFHDTFHGFNDNSNHSILSWVRFTTKHKWENQNDGLCLWEMRMI